MPNDTCKTDSDLAAIVAACPSLPEALKAGIVAMVKAAVGLILSDLPTDESGSGVVREFRSTQ